MPPKALNTLPAAELKQRALGRCLVKLGRITAGRPISASTSRASGKLFTIRPRQVSRPIFRIVSLKISRSSPRLMAAASAPIISTPCLARMPRCSSSMARLSAV